MRERQMVDPLNNDDRRKAIARFMVVVIITVLLIPAIVIIYDQYPKQIANIDTENPSQEMPDPQPDEEVPETANTEETLDQRIQQIIQERSQINLTLLVDATPGMGPYLASVAEAANAIGEGYALNLSAACYRDASEGQWMYLDNDMTGESPASWLKNLSTTVMYDEDEPEAVFYGMRQTLRSEHMRKNESNILILIGDAGNHAQETVTDVPASDVVDMLMEKRCHLAVIQTRQPTSHQTFADFGTQMRQDIVVQALQRYQDNSLKSDNEGDGMSLTSDQKHSYYLFLPGKNQKISSAALQSKITTYVDRTIAAVYRNIRALKAFKAGTPSAQDMDLLIPFLRDYGISKDEMDTYLQTLPQ